MINIGRQPSVMQQHPNHKMAVQTGSRRCHPSSIVALRHRIESGHQFDRYARHRTRTQQVWHEDDATSKPAIVASSMQRFNLSVVSLFVHRSTYPDERYVSSLSLSYVYNLSGQKLFGFFPPTPPNNLFDCWRSCGAWGVVQDDRYSIKMCVSSSCHTPF